MTLYRTRTYIAADFDHDKDAVDQLMKWNNSNYWALEFSNAHDLESCRDSSHCCTIKNSLRRRMNGSKRFVLIVGEHTNALTKGACRYCYSYDRWTNGCPNGMKIDHRSYIQFECDLAVKQKLEIIVLYKSTRVNTDLCPDSVRWMGRHLPMYCIKNGQCNWNYESVKNAFVQT